MSIQPLPTLWRRFSGRIVLILLLAAVFFVSDLFQYLGHRDLLFMALAAAVFLFWLPVRYLLSAAVGLLILAASLYMPLKEEGAEKTLRFVYYILVLVASRELVSAGLAPWRLSHTIKVWMARLESYHYQTLLWAARLVVATGRFVSSVLLNVIHEIRNNLFVVGKKILWRSLAARTFLWQVISRVSKRHVALAMPRWFTRISRSVEYALIPLQLLLRIRLIFFVLLTVAVVLPWFVQPGHLFLLDYAWPPNLPMPQLQSGFITSLPHEWVFWIVSKVIPTPVVQKVVFALPIFLAGLSASHLVGWIINKENTKAQPLVASLVAGTFYALNPFVVTRVFMGHIYFLLAYALVPWAALAMLRFLSQPSLRTGLVAGLVVVSVMISSAHHIILLPLILVPLFIRPVRARELGRSGGSLILPILLFVGAFLFFYDQANTASLDPQGPWARLLQAPFTANLWLDIVSLTAHWKTDLLFAFPYELLPNFLLFVTGLAILMGAGIWCLWQQRIGHAWLVWQLLTIAAVSIFLASGVAHPWSEPGAGWLYRHVPFWIGMRDSAKFMANLALVETIFLAAGVAVLMQMVPAKRLASSLIIILLLWFVSPAYAGFSGQVLPIEYPAGWSQWNDELNKQNGRPTMLVLPWHMYPRVTWLDLRPIINPASSFFSHAEVIVGDNSEVGGIGESKVIFSESRRPFSKKIERILEQGDDIEDFGSILVEDNITYVALLTDAIDVDTYQFLYRQEDLELIFENAELVVWQNNAL